MADHVLMRVPREVTAHVGTRVLILKHFKGKQQSQQRAVLTGVNDELVSYLILLTIKRLVC